MGLPVLLSSLLMDNFTPWKDVAPLKFSPPIPPFSFLGFFLPERSSPRDLPPPFWTGSPGSFLISLESRIISSWSAPHALSDRWIPPPFDSFEARGFPPSVPCADLRLDGFFGPWRGSWRFSYSWLARGIIPQDPSLLPGTLDMLWLSPCGVTCCLPGVRGERLPRPVNGGLSSCSASLREAQRRESSHCWERTYPWGIFYGTWWGEESPFPGSPHRQKIFPGGRGARGGVCRHFPFSLGVYPCWRRCAMRGSPEPGSRFFSTRRLLSRGAVGKGVPESRWTAPSPFMGRHPCGWRWIPPSTPALPWYISQGTGGGTVSWSWRCLLRRRRASRSRAGFTTGSTKRGSSVTRIDSTRISTFGRGGTAYGSTWTR